MQVWNTAILVFDGVEVLDFAGPFEVFSRTRLEPGVESRRRDEGAPFRVFTVAPERREIVATGGLRVSANFTIEDAPRADLLVVPGGFGTRALLQHSGTLDWIRRSAADARLVTSVCTGAALLARAGLLAGKRATTHWGSYDWLASLDPTITVERGVRYVDDGVITSAGVSAGLDMAFAVVERRCGREVAEETARYIEYRLA
jgi:transcriptional regulator GlxA family with amidase domain